MFFIKTLFPIWVWLISSTSAVEYDIHSLLRYTSGRGEYNACIQSLDAMVWDYTSNSTSYFPEWCEYTPMTGSLFLCSAYIRNTTNPDDLKNIMIWTATVCSYYVTDPPDWTYYRDQYVNATKYYVPSSEIKNLSAPIYFPTMPSNMTAVLEYFREDRNYFYDEDSGTWFGVGLCGYFLLLVIIGTIHNFTRCTRIGSTINKSKLVKYIQSFITLPALFPHGSYSKPVGFKWFSSIFPNRVQFLAETGVFIMQIAYYSTSYRKHDTIFLSAENAWQTEIADRAGIMCLAKLPLLVLFAGRNNFLCWLTGWSYMTFIQYHKIFARWMFLDALIHSSAYTANYKGYYVESLSQTYFACGIAATTLAGVIMLTTFHAFRSHFYEIFLVTHIVLVICFLAMVWWHINIQGWAEWFIAACCVWFFDRLIRVIRMIAFGYRTARLSIVGTNLIRVEVKKPFWWIHSPGQYGFIYFADLFFWQNHPFTVVIENGNIVMHVTVKRGVTDRMYKKLEKSENNTLSCKVCIEGPYGGSNSYCAKKYDDMLMIAGGTGAPGILDCAISSGKGKLVWIVKELKDIKPYSALLNCLSDVIIINIFVSREQGKERELRLKLLLEEIDSDSNENTSTDETSKDLSDVEKTVNDKGNILIQYGRPNMAELIPSEIETCPGNKLSIIVCGPPDMMDETRHYVSKEVLVTSKSIDYYDEFQTW